MSHHVNDLFRTISQERKKCIIMADFNIDLLTTDTNHQTADFIHNMFTHTFCPTISKPTRITNYSATVIDNIITNIHEYTIKSGILYNDISDHFPIFNIYKLGWQNTKKYKSIFKRNTNLKPSHGHNARISPTLPQGHSASKCPKSRPIITSPTSKHISHPANSFWHS